VASGFLFESSRGKCVRPQIDYRDILNAEKRLTRTWSIDKALVNQVFSINSRTERPLDYENLTKNVASLRENGQSVQREITLKLDTIVKNRRLAICWALHQAAIKNDSLDVSSLTALLSTQPELFVINEKNFSSVIIEECAIGFAAGIPFINEGKDRIRPICSVNLEILCANAPEEVAKFLEEQI
jgi:hypothetical protein